MFIAYDETIDTLRIETPVAVLHGTASFYGAGDGFHGRCMANGLPFNKEAMTAAHRFLPLGTRVRVKYLTRSVVVRITDRGPYVTGRIIDMSEGSARALGMIKKGVVRVTIEVLEVPASPETYHRRNPVCMKGYGERYGKRLNASV